AEVAADVGEARGEALEDVAVELFAAAFDALGGVLAQLLDRPVVARHAHDRAVQQTAALEPVERVEGHHLGEVAGDPEDDQSIGEPRVAVTPFTGNDPPS